jgi:dienelactone hydrolase
MKRLLFLFICLANLFAVKAQFFAIGETTITFNDPTRTGGFGSGGGPGRQIETKIYYPATTAGINTPVAGTNLPVVVFGHGFAMTWDAYEPLYDSLAGRGFVVALPRTEGSLLPAPSHGDFGKDLALVSQRMITLNTVATSLFFQKLNGRRAIGGHSMGGGSTFLANQYTTGVNCFFTLAAAETNPSAVAAAAGMTAPSLVIGGSLDCVAPPVTNQLLMYNSLASSCKTYVSITGAYHCQFNADNFNCNFGEGTCLTAGGLSRATQLTYVRALLIPYLSYFLKGECSGWSQFSNLIGSAAWLTSQNTCNQNLPLNPQVSGPSSFCEGDTVLLSALPAGFTYIWNNAANTGTIETPTGGTFSFSASNGICSNSSPNFSVQSEPSVENATIQASGPLNFCEGGSVTLTTNPANAPVIWEGGQTTPGIVVSQTADVWAFVGSPACGDRTETVQVTMIPYPSQVSMNLPSDSLFINIPYAFSVPVETGMSYEWICPLGNILSGQGTDSVQISFPFPGTAQVTCVISNQNCSLSIEEDVQAYVDFSSFSPVTGKQNISIFPNPTENELFIKGGFSDALWEIREISGKTILSGRFFQNHLVHLNELPPGAYLMSITELHSGEVFRTPLIKK